MNNWINVDDKLPEPEEQVLIYLVATKLQREKDREICHILTAALDDEMRGAAFWYDFQADTAIDEKLTKVTYWMHLPEKPEIGK